MSETDNNYDNLFEDDELEVPTLIRELRKALKAQQRVVKDKEAELGTIRDELTGLKTEKSSRTMAELLESKGAKPTLAKYMKDIEPTDEAVTKWLTENGDDFGYKSEAAGDGKPEEGAPSGEQVQLDPGMQAILDSMAKVQNHEASAAPGLGAGDDKNLEFLGRVGQNAHSFEDVEKALRAAGMLNGTQQ